MGQERESKAPPVRPHPKPEWGSVNSLNDTILRELWYLDTVVSSPFRALRRSLSEKSSPWSQSADELIWAVEGMARLPVKVLQSAFGEQMNPKPAPKDNS